jgi:hypothetical protein
MPTLDLQDRAQYLSLALFSQAVVSVLMEYVDENKREKLQECLGEALRSLQQAQDPRSPHRGKAPAFATYEHLRTLQEVWSPEDVATAIEKLRRVLTASRNARTKAAANYLIDLFSRLQVQALWNFEQPRPVSPKVMQRLCQLA